MKNQSFRAHIFLVFANLIYGINYTVAKYVMPDYLTPNGFVLLRSLAAATFFFVLWQFSKSKGEKWKTQHIFRVALCAIFGVCMNQLFFFKGIELTSPIAASLIMTSTPVLVMLISFVILKENLTKLKIVGVLIAMIGAILLIVQGKEMSLASAPNPFLGNLFVFINASCYALYLVLAKPLLLIYPPISVLRYLFLFGLIMVFPFGISDLSEVSWSEIPIYIWFSIAFVLLFVSCLTYFFNLSAMQSLKPSSVGVYIYSQPLFAALVAILLGSDYLEWVHFVAASLIFAGVYLVTTKKFVPTRK